MRSHLKARTRLLLTGTAVITAVGLLAGCTGTGAEEDDVTDQGTTTEENAESGDTVVIGFSGPAADHGWLGAINSGAQAAADSFDDVELLVHRRDAEFDRRFGVGDDDLLAEPRDDALVGAVHPGERLDERRLARTVLTEDAVHLARTHVQVDSSERLDSGERLRHAPDDE